MINIIGELQDIKLQYNDVFLMYTNTEILFYDFQTGTLLSELTIQNNSLILYNNNQIHFQLTNPIIDQIYIPKSDICIFLTTHDIYIFNRIYNNTQVFWQLKYTNTFNDIELTQMLVKQDINNTHLYITTNTNMVIYTTVFNNQYMDYEMGDSDTQPITQHIKTNGKETIIQNDKNIVSLTKNQVNWYLPIYQYFEFTLPSLEFIFLDKYIFVITRDKMIHYIQPNGKLLITHDLRESISQISQVCQDNIHKNILIQTNDNTIIVVKQSLLNLLDRSVPIYDSVITFPNEKLRYFYNDKTYLYVYTTNSTTLKLYRFKYTESNQYTLIDSNTVANIPQNVELKFQMNIHNNVVIAYQLNNQQYIINHDNNYNSFQHLDIPCANSDGINIYKTYTYYNNQEMYAINISNNIDRIDVIGLSNNEYNKTSIYKSLLNPGNRLNSDISNQDIYSNRYYKQNFDIFYIPNTYIKAYTPQIENIIPYDSYKTLNILLSHTIPKRYRNYKINPMYLVTGQRNLTFTEYDKQLFGTLYYELKDGTFSITRLNDKITINLLNRISQDWQGNNYLDYNIFDYYYSHLTDDGYQYRDFKLSIIYQITQNIGNINLKQFNIDIKHNLKSVPKQQFMNNKWRHEIILFNIKMINRQQSMVYMYRIPLKDLLYTYSVSYNFLDFNIKLIEDIQNYRTDIPYYVGAYTAYTKIKLETSIYDIEFYNFNTIELANNNESDTDNILLQIDLYNQYNPIRYPLRSQRNKPHDKAHNTLVTQ